MKAGLKTLGVRSALAAGVLCLGIVLSSQPSPREQVGPLAGGGFLLNSGWKLDPAGKQVPLDKIGRAHV